MTASKKFERKGAKRLDSQTTADLQTPPSSKFSRKEPEEEDDKPGLEVQAALRRPHTVDMENTQTRKEKAKTIQRNLSAEFREAKDTAAATPKATSKNAKDGSESNSNKRKTIDLGGAAKPAKLPKHIQKADKEKAAELAKQDAYALKDHATARSSNENAPQVEEVSGSRKNP